MQLKEVSAARKTVLTWQLYSGTSVAIFIKFAILDQRMHFSREIG
jgi:hypothetical protein